MRITINKIDKAQAIFFLVSSIALIINVISKELYIWSLAALAFSTILLLFIRNPIPLPIKILATIFNILALFYLIFKLLFWSQSLLLLRMSLILGVLILIVLIYLFILNNNTIGKIIYSNIFSILLLVIITFNSLNYEVFSNLYKKTPYQDKAKEESLMEDKILNMLIEYQFKLNQSKYILLEGNDKNEINILRSHLILELTKLNNLIPPYNYGKNIHTLINQQQIILINSASDSLDLNEFNILLNKTDSIKDIYLSNRKKLGD